MMLPYHDFLKGATNGLPGAAAFRIAVLALAFFLKINRGAMFLFLLLFSLLTPLLTIPLDLLGGFVLTLPALEMLFTALYNLPLAAYTRFNNTVVMGGLAAGILLWPAFFFGGKAFVNLYRAKLRNRIAEHPAMNWFLRLPVVSTAAKFVGRAVSLSQNF
jgi:uncharacterized protein (TIGR03546 family)